MAVGIQYQLRRNTAAAATSSNPVLAAGEPGFETDTGLLKIGDGATAWNSLPYTTLVPTATPASSGATGFKGQITMDGTYLYICIATNTWRRIAHSTW